MKSILAAVALCAAMISPAYANDCPPLPEWTVTLSQKHQRPVSVGVRGPAYFVIFADERGNWTLIHAKPGRACKIAEGSDFVEIGK